VNIASNQHYIATFAGKSAGHPVKRELQPATFSPGFLTFFQIRYKEEGPRGSGGSSEWVVTNRGDSPKKDLLTAGFNFKRNRVCALEVIFNCWGVDTFLLILVIKR